MADRRGCYDRRATVNAKHNTWEDPRIVSHPSVDVTDGAVRAAAEFIHRNESLHRHDPAGEVCVYCAISASRAAHVFARFRHGAAVPVADRSQPLDEVEELRAENEALRDELDDAYLRGVADGRREEAR